MWLIPVSDMCFWTRNLHSLSLVSLIPISCIRLVPGGLKSLMWLNRFDPEFIECRRVWLESYLVGLLDIPKLARSRYPSLPTCYVAQVPGSVCFSA